ncbi:hypothetical protein [Cohnella thailandensis]|uniref:Uncharacterized protein n=1 Tax=Cohnella thailandensis TaxID=557557 RepID=A0A841T6G9_9BACL|nr:hypothetical protein [Cohnella thailandensis]MBB6638295.1 hypothetical protein [Cohnella thailandensis]MBP1977226.1 hypothetical protein [Cohnella thailandensis]
MKWSTVREHYPEKWVLVEAIEASSLNSRRIIEEMSVMSDFPDSRQAWTEYKKFHLAEPDREFYIFFTGNESIEVIEQPFLGFRGKP